MKSKIEWTDETWNPVTGCTKVSQGCKNCYAESVAQRFWASHYSPVRMSDADMDGHEYRPRKFTDVQTHADRLDQPLRWRKPRRVFVNSMSDLFHEAVPAEFLDQVFAIMGLAVKHQFQVLTKRPERMRAYLNNDATTLRVLARMQAGARVLGGGVDLHWEIDGMLGFQLPNVWLGVSCEDQATADQRIPLLLDTPAAVRFVSCEPLLGPIDLGLQSATCSCCERWPSRWVRLHRPVGPDMRQLVGDRDHVADAGIHRAASNRHGALSVRTPRGLLGIKPAEFECLPPVDWVIVGGESGAGARPCDVAWIRSIVEQCKVAGVACFVKQLGGRAVFENDVSGFTRKDGRPDMRGLSLGLHDPKGGDPAEWPEDLRVREWPKEAQPA